MALGILGGSGFYRMAGVSIRKEHVISTPFGEPSSPIFEVEYEGKTFFFLARHGVNHSYLPSEVPYRANIYACKQVGITHLVGICAVGSMHEEFHPGNMVVPDQIFDSTKGLRERSFFGEGIVGHVAFANPFCQQLREQLITLAQNQGNTVLNQGTYVCVEGPRFSSRAESHFLRETLRPVAIGMTAMPEALLAREAEISYAILGLGTDYDCWHQTEKPVQVEDVLEVIHANSERATRVVLALELPENRACSCQRAAKDAIMTPSHAIPDTTKKRLELLYGKYWSQQR